MKLHSVCIGEGQPLLILHGFLGMSDNWKTLGNQYAENGFEVHLIDQRNHGKSPHSEKFNYNVLAEDVLEYCQTKNLQDICLMGHSMGGKTAMYLASKHPDLLRKLIVVDIAPKYYPPHHQKILQGLTALEEASLSSRRDAEDLLAEYIEDSPTRLFLLKNLYWKTKEKLALKLNLNSLKANIENIGAGLPKERIYDKSCVFIKAENSKYIQKKDFSEIRSHFPKAEIVEIKGAGHWVHAEKRKEFYQSTMKYLKKEQ